MHRTRDMRPTDRQIDHAAIGDAGCWRRDLETAGSAFFLRYRKRLFEPGILLTLWREYPGVPVLDLWLRLQAGRRVVAFGHGLEALAAIRRGERFAAAGPSPRVRRALLDGRRRDVVSRMLVSLGGLLSLAFAVLTMTAWLGPAGALLSLALAAAIVAGIVRNATGPTRRLAG